MHESTIKSRSRPVSHCILRLDKCWVGGNSFKCQGGRLVVENMRGNVGILKSRRRYFVYSGG
jgi:hypothetical protein